MLVSDLLENYNFLEHFLSLTVLSKILLIDALDSDHILCQMVQGEVDFSKGALTKNLANTIEINCGLGHRACATEAHSNVLADLLEDFLLRGQFRVMLN